MRDYLHFHAVEQAILAVVANTLGSLRGCLPAILIGVVASFSACIEYTSRLRVRGLFLSVWATIVIALVGIVIYVGYRNGGIQLHDWMFAASMLCWYNIAMLIGFQAIDVHSKKGRRSAL